jgi:RNA polymerase sigma factor (sigma-70 family)
MTGVLSVPSPRKAVGRALSEHDDHELVARVRNGDDRAFEILFERYQGRITAYVRGMVRDHGRAEDITQEVFFNALRRMRDTDRSIAFRPWIYEIAKNACIDAHRRSRRTQEVSYDNDEALGAADQGRLVSPRAVPDAVEARESLESLQGALGALSESHVDVIVLRELEGRSYAEIGEQLGMSRASVESTLFRARKRLESEYNDLVTGERCRQVQAAFATMSGGRPRLRDRRQISRHLAWCQSCRHQARLAGLDIEVAPRVPLRKKVGGLFPVPAFLREWFARGLMPGQIGGLGEPLFEWGRAAAAAVVVAVAGIGAGQVIGGGPVVDARPYAPGAAVYGGGGAVGASPVLGRVYALVGTQPALGSGGGGGLALPGTGALGAPVAAGPLAPQATAGAPGQPGGTGAAGTLPAGLRNPVQAAGASVGGAGGTLGGTVGGVTGAVGGAVGGLAGTTGGTVRGLTNTVNGTVQGTTGTAGGAVRDVGGTAGGAVRDVSGTANNTVNGVTRTANGLVRDVTTNPTNVGGAVNNAVRNTTQTVRGTVRDTSTTVNNVVRNTTTTTNNAVQGVTGTVNNTVRNTTQTVQGTVGGVTQTTTQAVQGVVNSLPKPAAPAQPVPTTQAAPAPAQTTASTPQPAPGPVQQVVQDTTSGLGGLLGGR